MKLIKITENIYIGRMNLELLALLFGFGTLGEIGNHAEAAAGVLHDGDGGSPSAEGGVGGPLRLHVKVVSQVLLHSHLLSLTLTVSLSLIQNHTVFLLSLL